MSLKAVSGNKMRANKATKIDNVMENLTIIFVMN